MRVASQAVALGSDFAIPVVAGAILGLTVITSPLAAICAIVGGLVAIFMGRDPIKTLGVLILVIPFLGTHWLSQNLTSLPGTKPYQILAVLVSAAAILNHRRAHGPPRWVIVFTISYLLFFTVCVLRAVPNIEFTVLDGAQVPTTGKFLLTEFIKPLIFFLPYIIIVAYCRSPKDIDLVVRWMAMATVALSTFLLFIYFRHARGLNVREATLVYDTHLDFHRNALGSLLIVGFPFLMARVLLRRSLANAAALCVTVAATCILFSRTAYAALALTPFIYAVISNRLKLIPIIVSACVLVLLLTPTVVRERALSGLSSNDVNEISAGRVDEVWLPLIDEYLSTPSNLIFGRGRFGITSTQASLRGQILDVKNSHNMYIEQVLDGGLLGLLFVSAFMARVFVPFFKKIGESGDVRLCEYRYAVAVSAICYFLGGLTGKTMFPLGESSFFWVTVALAVVIPLSHHESNDGHAHVKTTPAHGQTE